MVVKERGQDTDDRAREREREGGRMCPVHRKAQCTSAGRYCGCMWLQTAAAYDLEIRSRIILGDAAEHLFVG